MPTIKYINSNNVARNMSAYGDMQDAEKDLLPWQYVCSRLFKVSDVAPKEFRFIGDLEKNDTIQGQLYEQYLKRKDSNVSLDINSFSISKEMQGVVKTQMVPSLFEKDYLLLDLLITQMIIKEHGVEHVNEYGKKLVDFAEQIYHKDFKEIEISIELVNEVMQQESIDKRLHKIKNLENELQEAQNILNHKTKKISTNEKYQESIEQQIKYSLDDDKADIDSLKKKREYTEKHMNVINKLQLHVFRFLGKNTNHFYNDNLEKLEKSFGEKLLAGQTNLKKTIQPIVAENDELKQEANILKQKIDEDQSKIDELKNTLQAIKSIEMLSADKNYLDNDHVRDVERVTKDSNVVFLHSINAGNGFQPYFNSPLVKGVSFKDKVNQIRCFNPSVSCSSFKLDSDSKINDFAGPMGIIVTGGHITSASDRDDNTIAEIDGSRRQLDLSAKKIKEIINGRVSRESYDEFVISQTKTSALYVNYDRIMDKSNKGSESFSLIDTLETVLDYKKSDRDMPIMIIKNGNFHSITAKNNLSELIAEFKATVKNNGIDVESNEYKKMSEAVLEKGFYISEKKTVNDIRHSGTELEEEQKLKVGETLLKNYKPKYQDMIENKLNDFRNNLDNMRKKFNDTSKKSEYRM